MGLGLGVTALLVVFLGPPAQALPEDAEQPLSVNADQVSYSDDPNGSLELSGNVQLQQGTLHVAAERVRATKRDGKLHRVVATGGKDLPARFRQRINPGEPLVRAHAQTVDYSIAEQQTKLTGDAFLSTSEREYTGGTIIWDMKENRVSCRDGCHIGPPRPGPD